MRDLLISEVNWLYQALDRHGLDRTLVADFLGSKSKRDLPPRIHIDSYLALMNHLAEVSGDPLLGMHITENMDLSSLGVFGYLIVNAPTLREACILFTRYWATLTQASTFYLEEGKTRGAMRYQFLVPTAIPAHQEVESTLTGIIGLFQQRVGEGWNPERVTLQHSPQGPIEEYQRVFGPDVAFNQPANHIEFPVTLLDLRYGAADPALLGILREHANHLLESRGEGSPLIATVRLHIMSQLESGNATLRVVARQLCMSPRKLQMKLAEAKTQFQAIKDELRMELAKRALLESSSAIAHIAQTLGFAESASFNHTFRRLTGYSPRQYRQLFGPSIRP